MGRVLITFEVPKTTCDNTKQPCRFIDRKSISGRCLLFDRELNVEESDTRFYLKRHSECYQAEERFMRKFPDSY